MIPQYKEYGAICEHKTPTKYNENTISPLLSAEYVVGQTWVWKEEKSNIKIKKSYL